MPRLPVREGSRESLTKQSGGVRQDPNVNSQSGRDMQALGSGIISLADQVAKVQDVWDKARVTSQYTIAKNTRKSELNRLISEAQAEPDHEKSKDYSDQLENFFGTDVQIDDDNVKVLFDSEAQLDKDNAYTKLTEIFRHKMINATREGLVTDGDEAELTYKAGNKVIRDATKSQRMDVLKNAKETGMISLDEYKSEVEDIGQWEYNRAMEMITDDPKGVLEMLGKKKFDIKDPKQLLDLSNTAKATIKKNDYLMEQKTLEGHVDNQATMSNMIYGAVDPETGADSRGMSIADKLIMINEQDGLGLISEKFAVKARRYLTSVDKKVSVATGHEFARVLRLVSSVNARDEYGGKHPDFTFLKKIGQIQGDVMESNLPEKDKVSLLNTIATRTAKRQAEALIYIGGKEPFVSADEFFEENIPLQRDLGLMEYFNQRLEATKDGRVLTKQEEWKMQSNIMQRLKYNGKKSVIESMQYANDKFPNASYVEFEHDSKTGKNFLYVGIGTDGSAKKIPLDEYGRVIEPKKKKKPAPEPDSGAFGPRTTK